jgi:hypothetical protein
MAAVYAWIVGNQNDYKYNSNICTYVYFIIDYLGLFITILIYFETYFFQFWIFELITSNFYS